MKRIAYFLFAIMIIGALAACAPAPAAPTATATEKPTLTATDTPSPTATNTPTNTPELFELSFQAFYDYNGNGNQEEGEPNLENILIQTSAGECITRADGKCTIEGVPGGSYNANVADNRDVKPEEKIRYILPSTKSRIDINKSITLSIPEQTDFKLPLAHGSLVLPFPNITAQCQTSP